MVKIPTMTSTAGEIQSFIKSGATLTKKGWEWDKDWSKAQKQIECHAYIRGLQAGMKCLREWNAIIYG